MNRTTIKIILGCLCVALLLTSACKKKKAETPADELGSSFDTKGLLTNMANNIIVPSYKTLNVAITRLDSSVIVFNTNPNAVALLNLQNNFKDAYLAWQSCSEFQFGPADQFYLRENLNTFPTDTIQINNNIGTAGYNLATLVNMAAKGFPGMDFLLFGTGKNNDEILERYTNDGKAAARKQYLAALSADVRTIANNVLNGWSANYINTFINANGTDIGSSLGQLINALDFDVEILKNDKLGIPLGKQSMGAALPKKTEAFYCGISSQLAMQHLKAIQNIYSGKSSQDDALGFDDYLVKIKAQYNDASLNDAIKTRFTAAINDLGNVPDPLSATISNNPSVVNTAYTDIQKLLVLLKTDMPSSMGVLITYEDTDGD